MAEKAPAWNERDSKRVAQQGAAIQARTNWRKVTITSDPVTGNVVVEYGSLNRTDDVKHYSPTQFLEQARSIARMIGFHITP